MPLRDATSTPECWEDIEDSYVIFYASRGRDGVMWCPDCRAVEDFVKETFEAEGAPTAEIIYVGQRDEWKTPRNRWRQQPWNIQNIPTIVRVKDNERLVEGEIEDKLQDFIKELNLLTAIHNCS